MAIGPIGAVTYANQAMPAQASKQTNFQNRLDMQNALATEIADEDKEEIQELRPTEETYKIDPQNEHEKQKNKEEQNLSQNSKNSQDTEEEENNIISEKHIDIKI